VEIKGVGSVIFTAESGEHRLLIGVYYIPESGEHRLLTRVYYITAVIFTAPPIT
jgi:hypothetical protein